MATPIIAPANYVPQTGVTFSTDGDATIVDASHPLPVGERAYQGAAAIVTGVDGAPGRGVAINCSTAGNIVLRLADASLLAVSVDLGFSVLPFAVRAVVAAGTTAIATVHTLV